MWLRNFWLYHCDLDFEVEEGDFIISDETDYHMTKVP